MQQGAPGDDDHLDKYDDEQQYVEHEQLVDIDGDDDQYDDHDVMGDEATVPVRQYLEAVRELAALRADLDGLRGLLAAHERWCGEMHEQRELRNVERDRVHDERDRRYQAQFTAVEKAADRAISVSNEFRGQLKDQADTFVRRDDSKMSLQILMHIMTMGMAGAAIVLAWLHA